MCYVGLILRFVVVRFVKLYLVYVFNTYAYFDCF